MVAAGKERTAHPTRKPEACEPKGQRSTETGQRGGEKTTWEKQSEMRPRSGRRRATDGPSIEEGNYEAQNGKTHQKFVEEAPRGKSTILSVKGQKESHKQEEPCGKRVTRRASPEEEGHASKRGNETSKPRRRRVQEPGSSAPKSGHDIK